VADTLFDSKKTCLIASDIFGMSEAFLSLVNDVNIDDSVLTVVPYQQPQTVFKNEAQAYQCFQDYGGITAYIHSLKQHLKCNLDIKQVIGFSAGAAAIYKAMSELSNDGISINNLTLILFYPSQIRHYSGSHINCRCHIIFPEFEPHFSLPDVIQVLQQQSGIKVEQSSYQHGFMNRDSRAFDQTAYNHYCQMLNRLLVKV